MRKEFREIYRILSALRSQLDAEESDAAAISPEALKIAPARLDNLMALLVEDGYVSGVSVTAYDDRRAVVPVCPRITIAGLEFLEENAAMKRAARVAKGIAEAV